MSKEEPGILVMAVSMRPVVWHIRREADGHKLAPKEAPDEEP